MASEDSITQDDNPHALIVRAPDERQSILLMDRTDLEQAMAELAGSVIEQFVYVAKGKKQLTYAGIKEAARLYRNIHFGATATPLPDGSWMITSYAHNLADNTRVDYPMPYPPFDPADKEASLEFRATLSKSIRNALAAVLPVAYLNTMIARWMEQKGVQTGVRVASAGGGGTAPREPQKPHAEPAAAKGAGFTERAASALQAAASHAAPAGPEGGDPAAQLRPEVVRLLEADGGALDLLRQKGPLPADMTAEQLARAKDWLVKRAARLRLLSGAGAAGGAR